MGLKYLCLFLSIALNVANGEKKCFGGDKPCLPKGEVNAVLKSYLKEDDPCFDYKGGKYCFVTNKVESPKKCTCKGGSESPIDDGGKTPPDETGGSTAAAEVSATCDLPTPSGFETKCGEGYGNDNTMCQYSSMVQPCGTDLCQHGLTKKDQDFVVAKHNELRRKVAKGQETRGNNGAQPKAANMNELVWSDELAEVAQRWTDQCPAIPGSSTYSMHDRNRKTVNFPCVGQNYANDYINKDEGKNLMEKMTLAWYDEVEFFNKDKISKFDRMNGHGGNVIGHYSEVVWANIRYIGCGYVKFTPADYKHMNSEVLVCNYAITHDQDCWDQANFGDQSMYIIGEPGSKCEKDNDGLCACIKRPDGYCKE